MPPTVPRIICPNETNCPHAICPNEIVGAMPMCPSERPRSGVSIPKIHALCARNLTTDAPLQGDTGGHTGTAPTNPRNIFPHNSTQKKITIYTQSAQTTSTIPHAIHPKRNQPSTHNLPKRNQPSTRNPPKRSRRGGACVPARTSARRRFHIKNIRIVCGELNDGCALVGRHGRAHRHRPYPAPSYFSTQSHTNKIPFMRNPPK